MGGFHRKGLPQKRASTEKDWQKKERILLTETAQEEVLTVKKVTRLQGRVNRQLGCKSDWFASQKIVHDV